MKDFNTTDTDLWLKLKNGDLEAVGFLYDIYIDDLFVYGVQFTSDKSKVMDCIHDLFLNLYKYRKKLSETPNVKYYLMRSLKNEILKSTKTNVLLNSSTLDEKKESKHFAASFEEHLIEDEILNDKVFKLQNALKILTPKQRHILLLRYNQDKEYDEIASILEVSVETSRTLIYRAIKKLRKALLTLILVFFNFF